MVSRCSQDCFFYLNYLRGGVCLGTRQNLIMLRVLAAPLASCDLTHRSVVYAERPTGIRLLSYSTLRVGCCCGAQIAARMHTGSTEGKELLAWLLAWPLPPCPPLGSGQTGGQ